MSAIKLHVIKPSVNNMTARVFVRAAKLDFTEDDVYGKTRSEEFIGQEPVVPDADDRVAASAEGRHVGELRDHAVSLQQASSRQLLSDRAGEARDGGQRDVLHRRHALPLSRARDLRRAPLPAVCGRGRRERRGRRGEGQGAEGRSRPRSARRSRRSTSSSSTARPSSAATTSRSPTSALPAASSS